MKLGTYSCNEHGTQEFTWTEDEEKFLREEMEDSLNNFEWVLIKWAQARGALDDMGHIQCMVSRMEDLGHLRIRELIEKEAKDLSEPMCQGDGCNKPSQITWGLVGDNGHNQFHLCFDCSKKWEFL